MNGRGSQQLVMAWFRFHRRAKYQIVGDDEDFLLVTWDSCRYDTYRKAKTPVLDQFGEARRAWAMGTYTLPSLVAMYYGFLPHAFAAEPFYNRYRQQLWRICHRNVHAKPLVTFPLGTKNVIHGFHDRRYFTVGVAAMDWFRDAAALRDGFEEFRVTGTAARRQNEILATLIEKNARHRPVFALVNYGETHSPFRCEGMPDTKEQVNPNFSLARLFNQQGLLKPDWELDARSFDRQVACAEYLDGRMQDLLDFFRARGRPATIVVCSDHGECFGEDGMFGHAFYHEKVMEVFLLIFRINAPPHAQPEMGAAGPKTRGLLREVPSGAWNVAELAGIPRSKAA